MEKKRPDNAPKVEGTGGNAELPDQFLKTELILVSEKESNLGEAD